MTEGRVQMIVTTALDVLGILLFAAGAAMLDDLAALHAEYEQWAESMELTTRVLVVDATENFADPDAVWAEVQAFRL